MNPLREREEQKRPGGKERKTHSDQTPTDFAKLIRKGNETYPTRAVHVKWRHSGGAGRGDGWGL